MSSQQDEDKRREGRQAPGLGLVWHGEAATFLTTRHAQIAHSCASKAVLLKALPPSPEAIISTLIRSEHLLLLH